MKTRENDFDAKVAELERAFQSEISELREQNQRIKQPRPTLRHYGNPRPSSIVCGLLAGTFLLGLQLAQDSMLPTAQFCSEPIFVAPANPLNDPHTIEGTAAIHKSMQSGIVNVSKSTITGILDSNSMTASLYWTFVLKNNNNTDKEAAFTIELPKNAVVSRATLWINGVAQEAAFSSNQQVKNAYDSIVVRHRDPLLVTQIAPNKIKVLAAPVTANGGEMKFRIGITAPAEVGANGKNFLSMPRVIESNLKFDSKQDIHLNSNTRISGIGETDKSGIYTLRANVPADELGKVKIRMKNSRSKTFATRLTHTSPTEYVQGQIVDGELELKRTNVQPGENFIHDDDVAFRLSSLWAHQEIERLAAAGKVNDACNIANVYRIVSSVSGATVLEESFDYSNNGLNRDEYRIMSKDSSSGSDFTTIKGFVPYSASQTNSAGQATVAPMLVGATNGTISPLVGDATIIQGVNTSGFVRVNNLANLEAILMFFANIYEIIGVGIIAFLVNETAVNRGLKLPILRLSRTGTIFLAIIVGAIAFSCPCIVESCIAWARDVNLFS